MLSSFHHNKELALQTLAETTFLVNFDPAIALYKAYEKQTFSCYFAINHAWKVTQKRINLQI
jgi:hypothetical protein